MKGSVGTPTTMVYIKDKRKKIKKKGKRLLFCYRCRSYIREGEWMKPLRDGYSHLSCPK